MRALYLSTVWPERTSSAAGLRTWNWLEALARLGAEIHFVATSQSNDFEKELHQSNIQTRQFLPNDPSFDPWVKELAPNVVVYDRFILEEQFGWRVEEQVPSAVRILETQDLHSVRRSREAWVSEHRQLPKRDLSLDLTSPDFARELASCYRSDAVVVCSKFEKHLLDQNAPALRSFWVPFGYPQQKKIRRFDERNGFVFIGNFRHAPNLDSIRWLKSELWPAIRAQMPEATLNVYGAYQPREVSDFNSPGIGFYTRGHAPDQFEVISQAKALLAPLRFGAGIKGKISDAWSVGTPVITTWIGAEGMVEGPFPGLICEGKDDFARAAKSFDEDTWKELSLESLRISRESYSIDAVTKALGEIVMTTLALREKIQRENTVGFMLRHHQHQSTKYFSKWIEEKNKR